MTPEKETAIVLVSGGMDSCVTAAIVNERFTPAFLHVNYGQRTERRELQAFSSIADHYAVSRRLVASIAHLREIGGSGLTDPSIQIPHADLHRKDIPVSYVPFRNANILSIAVSWAEVIGATAIAIGAVEEDSSGYPDCRGEFFEAFNAVIRTGTRPDNRCTIITPILHCSKREIVETGIRLNAPLHLTWSCYTREDLACGECDSCALRLRGFQQAGFDDPIPYQKKPLYT